MKKLIAILFILFTFSLISGAKTEVDYDADNYTKVNASHILVDSKSRAKALKNRIESGESFMVVARKYSACPSGEFGGSLGEFGRGQMVKEFEDAAFSLPVGVVSEPVKTDYGWHLIKVYEKK